MKIRAGFVSNSSSSSFIITNKTDKVLTLEDFVREAGEEILNDFVACYDWYKDNPSYTFDELVLSAIVNNEDIHPGRNEMVFGDEDGTMIGNVFDYGLRDGGESENFTWWYHEALR